jgi:hypothetical protein
MMSLLINSQNIWLILRITFQNFVELWLVIMEDYFALLEDIKTMFAVIGC